VGREGSERGKMRERLERRGGKESRTGGREDK